DVIGIVHSARGWSRRAAIVGGAGEIRLAQNEIWQLISLEWDGIPNQHAVILVVADQQAAVVAWDEKAGAAGSVYDILRDRRLPHRAEVFAGVEEAACAAVLREFFEAARTEL
ncbi:MAG: hypothetical protein V4479_08795, partial [Actinomycetota bacterium]